MMKICRTLFNIYLLAVLLGLTGCQSGTSTDTSTGQPASAKKPNRRETSTLRFHYTINQDTTDRCLPITVYRNHPMTFYIDRTPFLWEVNVTKATVVTNLGTYALRIEFDRQGAITMQTFTTTFKSRHIAIYSDFGQSRWLAAPVITRIVTDGIFEFTPDASLEETERIARGLNNLVRHSETYFDRRDRRQRERLEQSAQP